MFGHAGEYYNLRYFNKFAGEEGRNPYKRVHRVEVTLRTL